MEGIEKIHQLVVFEEFGGQMHGSVQKVKENTILKLKQGLGTKIEILYTLLVVWYVGGLRPWKMLSKREENVSTI